MIDHWLMYRWLIQLIIKDRGQTFGIFMPTTDLGAGGFARFAQGRFDEPVRASGQIDWQRTIGGGKGIDWAGEDIDLTPNGGAIIAVDNGEFGFLLLEPFL